MTDGRCEPDCTYEPGHLGDHPCGLGHERPGDPCRNCSTPVPLDGSPCPECWTSIPDNLADAKALLALGDFSVDPVRGVGS